jgi:hypothetical protein
VIPEYLEYFLLVLFGSVISQQRIRFEKFRPKQINRRQFMGMDFTKPV